MITIYILLFAGLADAAGKNMLEVHLPEGCTVAQLLEHLGTQEPALQPWLGHVRVAINHAYATPETIVPVGAEFALIPPVSGG